MSFLYKTCIVNIFLFKSFITFNHCHCKAQGRQQQIQLPAHIFLFFFKMSLIHPTTSDLCNIKYQLNVNSRFSPSFIDSHHWTQNLILPVTMITHKNQRTNIIWMTQSKADSEPHITFCKTTTTTTTYDCWLFLCFIVDLAKYLINFLWALSPAIRTIISGYNNNFYVLAKTWNKRQNWFN